MSDMALLGLTCKDALVVFSQYETLRLQKENAELRKRIQSYEFQPKFASIHENESCHEECPNFNCDIDFTYINQWINENTGDVKWFHFEFELDEYGYERIEICLIERDPSKFQKALEKHLNDYYKDTNFTSRQAIKFMETIEEALRHMNFKRHILLWDYMDKSDVEEVFCDMVKRLSERLLQRHPIYFCTECKDK